MNIRSRETAAGQISPPVQFLYGALYLLTALALAASIRQGRPGRAGMALAAAAALPLPRLLARRLHLRLPPVLESVVLLFIAAHILLGEAADFYVACPWWDKVLHTLYGFLSAAVGLSLIDVFHRDAEAKFRMAPLFCVTAACCFSVTVGVLWEFFECLMDLCFHMDMQKDMVVHSFSSALLHPAGSSGLLRFSDVQEVIVDGSPLGVGGYLEIGLYDTMIDLGLGLAGALFFAPVGFRYLKSRGKSRIAACVIPVFQGAKRE